VLITNHGNKAYNKYTILEALSQKYQKPIARRMVRENIQAAKIK
jgi:hypothetical protein